MKELGKATTAPFFAHYITVGPTSPLKPAEGAGMTGLPAATPPLPLPLEVFMGMDQLCSYFSRLKAVQVMKELHGGEQK